MPPIPPPQPLPPTPVSYNILSLADEKSLKSSSTVSRGRPAGLSFTSTRSTSTNDTLFTRPRTDSVSSVFEDDAKSDSAGDLPSASKTGGPQKRFYLENSIGGTAAASIPSQLFPVERLESLSERSLAMHLFRSYQTVLSCREALWGVLSSRINNNSKELEKYGWVMSTDQDQNMESFERLLTRYERYVCVRGVFFLSRCSHIML